MPPPDPGLEDEMGATHFSSFTTSLLRGAFGPFNLHCVTRLSCPCAFLEVSFQ
jgi:hypothetical protein